MMRKPVHIVFFVYGILALMLSGTGLAEERQAEMRSPQKINLTMGKSLVIETSVSVKRVSVAAPDVADALVLSPQQIYIAAKSPGLTNLTIWDTSDRAYLIYDVEVSPDITRLKEKLHEIMPEEQNIRVISSHDYVTLTGTVSSATNAAQAEAVAESYAPKKVLNMLQVGGVQQVMLEVRVSEISRSLLRSLGVNFNSLSSSGKVGLSLLNNLSSVKQSILGDKTLDGLVVPGADALVFDVSSRVNGIFNFVSDDTSWIFFIDALKENGLVTVLAEPTLLTLSGQTANFLAGGEFPIPVPQGFQTVTIEYKPFGVGLAFTPTVLDNGKISMQVAPEVSELDFTTAISLSGFVIPGLSTRRVSTTIELEDGQSFAIAGLLKDDVREVVSKFPVLGEIPVIGALFRSSQFRKNESELIVVVTPHLVKPFDAAEKTLPTDKYSEPDDFEFYLLGELEGSDKPKERKTAVPKKAGGKGQKKTSGLEGDFGYLIP